MTQTVFPFATIGAKFDASTERTVSDPSERRNRTGDVPTPMPPPVEAERDLFRVFSEQSLSILDDLDKELALALPVLMNASRVAIGKDPFTANADAATGRRRVDAGGAWLISTLKKKRQDALAKIEPLTAFFDNLAVQYGLAFDLTESTRGVQAMEQDLVELSSDRWGASMRQTAEFYATVPDALGVFLVTKEPAIAQGVSNRFIERNVRMIRIEGSPRVPPIPQQHFKKLERTIRIAVHRNIRPEETLKALQKIPGISRRRAEVIARDQVGKHNGQMNETRHKGVGVKRYKWRTVGDGSVRDGHVARDGKIFSYASPPPDGNPGEPVQCRCWAEPYLQDVLGQEAA